MHAYDVVMIGPPCIDEYYRLENFPEMGGKVLCSPLGKMMGGMIANAAAIIASYGVKTALVDYLNDSDTSRDIIASMNQAGVGSELIGIDKKINDAKCIILLHQGERAILVVENDRKDLPLSARQSEALLNAKAVYTTVTDLKRYSEHFDLLTNLKKNNVRIIYDVERSTISANKEDFELLKMGDVLFLNESGVENIKNSFGTDSVDVLTDCGCLIVLTLGSRGCGIITKNGERIQSPAFPVRPVDTTGAGDTFNASFVYGLLHDWPLKECAAFANAAAARSITEMGPRSGAQGTAAVYEFMNMMKDAN